MKRIFPSLFLLLFVFSSFSQEAAKYFQPLKFRNIGPFRGGRSVAASGVKGDPLTYYMGTTGGGLWKTTDAGQRWTNISDGYFGTGSVGAVAVSESNQNVVYCGMGEHAVRGVMTSYGDGVYKSTDAGKTWKKTGLDKTEQIARIVIHPTDPDIVYVAAQGALHGPTKERGVYKSTDGGKTWKNVLFINETTGSTELSMDMNNPNVLYTAMWHHQRTPWKIISGGEGSGLYKSTDAGETWYKIHEGLPEEKGKMAVTVSRSNPNKVYALIESDTQQDKSGLFVSENAGSSWQKVSGDNRLTQRAWYYIEVFTDPDNENVVYVLSAPALRSIDGGKNWEVLSGTHGDYHDLWINPDNSRNMVIANDGGAAISFDEGKTWSTQANMPTAQLYRINSDNLFPYNIYAGQQDNTSLKISSLSLGSGGISERDWEPSAGGESAFLAFDPQDPRYVYGGSYLGTIEVMDMESKTATNIMVTPNQYLGRAARDMEYLFNWNAPIIWSVHEPGTVYHAAQMVLRTRDKGYSWEEISPDLTRNQDDKQGKGGGPLTNEAVGAENYGTISYLLESPWEKGVFWTGSDDGLVHISKNNGDTWENVTPKGLKECLINAIEVSPHNQGTAYIATTRYKFNDYTPAIYKTTDYGKTWTNISSGIPYGAFTRVVREDPAKAGLLYAGTETGLYISWNAGRSWEPFQLNLPVTPVTDLKVHKGDLIVATSGRSFWVLDDLAILSQYNKSSSEARLYDPEPLVYGSWSSQLNSTDPDFSGSDAFQGVNPANGVVIYYQLPELSKEVSMELIIKNKNGEVIRSFSAEKDPEYKPYEGSPPPAPTISRDKGLNRFVWDTRYPTIPGIPEAYIEASFKGHKVNPGNYTISLLVGGREHSTTAVIEENPLLQIPAQQFETYDEFMTEAERTLTQMHIKVNSLKKVQEQINEILLVLKAKSGNKELITQAQDLITKLVEWDEKMVQRKSKAYDDVENFENKFTAEYLFLINQTESSLPRVNKSSMERKTVLDARWKVFEREADFLINSSIPKFNEDLWKAGIGAIQIK